MRSVAGRSGQKKERDLMKTCDYETWDGNQDDPSYYYCGLPQGHAGDHGQWRS